MFHPQRLLNKAQSSLVTPLIAHVHSIDFHDCLFNQKWLLAMKALSTRQSKILITTNKGILNAIKKSTQADKPHRTIFMLGSGAQSYIDDQRHRIKGLRKEQPISVFQGLNLLYEASAEILTPLHTKVELDSYLLADTFNNLNPGVSFAHALTANQSGSPRIQHANWVLDDTKMLIVYAQVHKAASSLPRQSRVKYHFYDDKLEILNALNTFYKNNSELIPRNTTLILNRYSGEEPEVIHVIRGTGSIDENYSQSIQKIVALCGYEYDFITITRLTEAFNSERVEAFKIWSNLSRDDEFKLPLRKPGNELVVARSSSIASPPTFFKKFNAPKPIIKILSFDFDKCIGNERYLKILKDAFMEHPDMTWGDFLEIQNKALCLTNKTLMKQIALEASQTKDISSVEIILNSARQSYQDDLINRLSGPVLTGSAYQALLMLRNRFEYELSLLSKRIPVKINYLLLTDVYADLAPGSSYRLALARMHENSTSWHPALVSKIALESADKQATWIFDDSKLTIVYAHVHEACIKNPNADFIYDFYDDRSDILEHLAAFLRRHLTLIPTGITLTLNKYSGDETQQIAVLKGQGTVDHHYAASIKKMVELSGYELNEYSRIINVLTGLNNNVDKLMQWRSDNTTRFLLKNS